jgi:hypothetical protein
MLKVDAEAREKKKEKIEQWTCLLISVIKPLVPSNN